MSIAGKYVVYKFLMVRGLGGVFTSIKNTVLLPAGDGKARESNHPNTSQPLILYDKLYRLYPDKYKVTVETDIDDRVLDAKLLSTLGIMLNEHVANSLKHAFPETRTGAIRVELKSPAPDRAEFSYRDNGIGMPDSVLSGGPTGLGMMIIRGMADQIGGTLKISRERGTFISMVVKTAD